MPVSNLTADLKTQLDGERAGGPLGQPSKRFGLGTIIDSIITAINTATTTAGAAIPKAAFTATGKLLKSTGAGTYTEIATTSAATASAVVERDSSGNINGAVLSGTKLFASSVPGANEAAAAELAVFDPQAGGDLRRHCIKQTASVATGGAATTVTVNIPAGSAVVGGALKVETDIAGIDSTTGTLALSGGASDTILTISAFTTGTKAKQLITPADCTATTQLTFTLSGGSDNTPSGGSITVIVYYDTIDAMD